MKKKLHNMTNSDSVTYNVILTPAAARAYQYYLLSIFTMFINKTIKTRKLLYSIDDAFFSKLDDGIIIITLLMKFTAYCGTIAELTQLSTKTFGWN